jgi:UDPglucose 6-dehydrogenase
MTSITRLPASYLNSVARRESDSQSICIIGTGYVGLVTGTALAELGNQVTCVDTNDEKVCLLCSGKMPIYEPGLEDMVKRNCALKRLSFSTKISEGIRNSDIVFIAVGTPPGPGGDPDLSQLVEAAVEIAQHLDHYTIIVNKSTVPVGTAQMVSGLIERNRRRNVDFDVASNPEFLREGSAVEDAFYPDRIVIGAPTSAVAEKLSGLYAPLQRPIFITDVTSAEIIKYASNAFLACKISYINSLASLCEEVGGDIKEVARGMGADRRIGDHFLQAGLGFGGSCFGKDVKALLHTLGKHGCDTGFLESTLKVNDLQPVRFVHKLESTLLGLEGKKIAVLGLAFKPNTDDMRDAKSVDVIRQLLAKGATVNAYDPVAMENARTLLQGINYGRDPYEIAQDAHAVLLITEWPQFKTLDFDRIRKSMARALLFDGRNLFDPDRMRELGFEYHCIGRACANGISSRINREARAA